MTSLSDLDRLHAELTRRLFASCGIPTDILAMPPQDVTATEIRLAIDAARAKMEEQDG